MAEGFEPFHVPQQSRRDKLRVVLENQQPNSCQEQESSLHDAYGGLLPSLIPSHMLETRTNNNNFRRNQVYCVKQEGRNPTMGYYVGGFLNSCCNSASSSCSSSSSSSSHHYSLDPQASLPININYSSIQDNNNHFLYQTLRESEHLSSSHQQLPPSAASPMYRPQALSLSLSSQHQQLNLPRPLVGGGGGGGASTSNDIRSAVPLGPFTGYASILKGSRFLLPAQQLLEDFCHVGHGIYVERNCGDSSSSLLMDSSMENFNDTGFVDEIMACSDGGENRRKKTRLISLLEEVYRRYKVYYQQMQAIVASFESVAGLANAAPYTSFALKAMSKHFRSLKNAITDQLRFSSKCLGEVGIKKDGPLNSGVAEGWIHDQRTAHNPGILEPQPIWRPQRGLPERAVAVLKAWLFEHFLHPYPTDTDKQSLAKQTGLSRSQVSNWFINARVRLWKPMVEEIHMLETCQSENNFGREDQVSNKSNEIGTPSHFSKQRQVKSALKPQDNSSKRSRSELPNNSGPMNFTYNNLSSHHEVGNNGLGTSGGNSGVSLTLGLQQNNAIGLSEALPMNIARRFGLEASNEGYIGSFEAQNHHFSRDLGGRLLRDYVG